MFDNKDTVDLIQTQACSLDVEEPDERQPGSVEDGKYDVEPPPNVLYTLEMVSVQPKPNCCDSLTDWCNRHYDVDTNPISDHGNGRTKTARSVTVDFRRIQEADAHERHALSRSADILLNIINYTYEEKVE